MSLFITFEGGEGSGKSFQARALYRRLLKSSVPALLTHEPGGTPLGRKMERLLKRAHDTGISPLAELLLFNASRTQLVTSVIRPGLKKGTVVICDRYDDSTTAYQGYGRGLDLEVVRTINNTATGGLKPDLTLLLDIAAEAGLSRKRAAGQDRFEREDLSFHRRIRQGYLKMAASEPSRWLVIDTSQPKKEVAGIIWQRVSRMLTGRGG